MFLSQRPNNDPKPLRVDNSDGHVTKGKTRFAVNDPYKYRNAKFVFDPRPEFTQTRDPYPYVGPNGATRHAFPGWLGSDRLAWSPRHEEFDTPVNPILAEFRSTWTSNYREGAQNWLIYIDGSWGIKSIEHSTVQQRDHARRVLSKLVAVYGD